MPAITLEVIMEKNLICSEIKATLFRIGLNTKAITIIKDKEIVIKADICEDAIIPEIPLMNYVIDDIPRISFA
jgi:hypothetical protein